jgi:hypothetical protein
MVEPIIASHITGHIVAVCSSTGAGRPDDLEAHMQNTKWDPFLDNKISRTVLSLFFAWAVL